MNSWPTNLQYLESVLRKMEKIPSDQLDEDNLAMPALDDALRNRVKGLKLRDAISRLTEDRDILRKWLKETKVSDGPAFWIAGYLMRPGLVARGLLAPPPPPLPTIEMEPPDGWHAIQGPGQLTIEQGKVIAVFTVTDEASNSWMRRQAEARGKVREVAGCDYQSSESAVEFGKTRGYKYVIIQSGRVSWKKIEYLFEVPGGFLRADFQHRGGKEFDESEVEHKLHTLRVVAPASRYPKRS